jgi:peptidoglycan hydrolase-like protein with peptidoglycan-binding domain
MLKKYPYNSTERISEHFTVNEFRCKCSGHHDTLIDTNVVDILERLRDKLGCSRITLPSGYRCHAHDKAVGGSGTGYHTKGCAVDFIAWDKSGKIIPSAQVVLALEELGGVYGIGLNCGGSKSSTHVDCRPAACKWWGDESIKGWPSISRIKPGCTSYHVYLGVESKAVCPYKQPDVAVGRGLRGDAVRWVQWMLVKRCGEAIKIDGVFGNATLAAVQRFQRAHGIAVDGIVGKVTVGKLIG